MINQKTHFVFPKNPKGKKKERRFPPPFDDFLKLKKNRTFVPRERLTLRSSNYGRLNITENRIFFYLQQESIKERISSVILLPFL